MKRDRYLVRKHGRDWIVYDFAGHWVGWRRSSADAIALVHQDIAEWNTSEDSRVS